MSRRKPKGYAVRVGSMWVKPGPGGSIALSGCRAGRCLFAYAEDARETLADIGGEGRGAVVRVFATRKPKPAPVVAGERYALLTEDSGDAHFQDINDGSAGYPRDAQRAIGTHAQAVAHHAKWGGEVVRILADGEHEAAVAKAREEAAEAARSGIVERLRDQLRRCPDAEVEGLRVALATIETKNEAAKGCAK